MNVSHPNSVPATPESKQAYATRRGHPAYLLAGTGGRCLMKISRFCIVQSVSSALCDSADCLRMDSRLEGEECLEGGLTRPSVARRDDTRCVCGHLQTSVHSMLRPYVSVTTRRDSLVVPGSVISSQM